MSDSFAVTPNVITEVALKQRLQSGSVLAIRCSRLPTRTASTWHGIWTMEVHHPDGNAQMLVTARSRLAGEIAVRQFKTATGIVSFLVDCGFSKVTFPVTEGGIVKIGLND
ncbi:hypothetical protein [Phaeobacter sp. JH20_18]|uniref:hypothetical protein n=1 Tax=Phaeobacter sp. JH20_18 TaxID=3112476 RepID=UPI003A882285